MWKTTISRKGLINEIVKNFNTSGFYHWEGVRYFLYEYEVFLKSSSKSDREKLNWEKFCIENEKDYISVEHIYPQTARKQCWASKYKHYSQKERNQLKNTLGNLVPLSKPKNSSLSNKCFVDKKSRKDDAVGFAFGCYSENEVALNNDWTATEILYRSIKMAKFFERRWNIPFESNKQLLDLLGIGFVLKKEGIDEEKVFSKFQ